MDKNWQLNATKITLLNVLFFIYSFFSLLLFKSVRAKWLSLKPWGIALKFLFLHHENILFPND
ncbi:hypothetical protein HMPREF1074_04071 [Bacteroides xylanisolvens CL03T12C04]|uniref:Uncharacterized protein n=1 Tax=Bacteroides xylanisolvens CL03T12C04 TaxID=997892 RepID=I9AAS9_9BACE|nr:hypothetical protein HMPREF1074_04071 [Bacteroides xylanisolvens CL03T12C04]MBT0703520.1 hypothetical protein [Bacteroides xylanisolvens CL03T12C04]